jgi:hypothetical protein
MLVLSWLALRPFLALSDNEKVYCLKMFQKYTKCGITSEKEIVIKVK